MKLWQKDFSIDKTLEAFTVGIDYQLDQHLVVADCMASVAQARTLLKAGLLTAAECSELEAGLRDIARRSMADEFAIRLQDEDCHTAIELDLTARCGESGKKIHTGRSRNDQVLTALRLYEKAMLLSLRQSALVLADAALDLAERHRDLPMPGRTHMQTAMPSSVGLWASAIASQVMDDLALVDTALRLVDRSPLGAGAGYGVPLPLDREFSAAQMGFASVHLNVLASQNSRGKLEAVILDACEHLCLGISKFAQDLILFSLPEFGYCSLPKEMTTGSSIMPQKKNPDGLELLRSRSALVSGWASQVKGLVRSLPTGYNRDFQDSKEALIRGLQTARDCVRIMAHTLGKLEFHPQRLREAHGPELFATDEAYRLVAEGMSFRDAYREVGLHLERLEVQDPDAALRRRTAVGTPGNLCLDRMRQDLASLGKDQLERQNAVDERVAALLGDGISLCR